MFIAVWLRILENEKQLKVKIEGWLSKWLCLHTNHPFIENNLLWPPSTWHNSVLCWSCEGSGTLSLPHRLEADRYKKRAEYYGWKERVCTKEGVVSSAWEGSTEAINQENFRGGCAWSHSWRMELILVVWAWKKAETVRQVESMLST